VIAAVVAYAPTIHDYFLQDDFGVVGLLSQKSWSYFPRWFVAPWTENVYGYVPDEIRPFPALSYQIAGAFGAASPVPNHILNIAIHALNGLLVMWIAQAAAGTALVPAMFAGLVFVLLPIQAESVAWVTGRVDSLPTCFYFASFLLFVRWRRSGRSATYLWSLTLFFAALFSKQNTITLAPALVLFDIIVDRRHSSTDAQAVPSGAEGRLELSWKWIRPYVPYVLLTAAFLMLRYVLFHEVAREGVLNAQRVREFLSDSSRHLVRLVFGGAGLRHWAARDTVIVCFASIAVAFIAARVCGRDVRRLWRPAIYFGVIWIAFGMAPILVSGYYSPRHMYLASLGWTVTLGIALDILWRARPVRYARLAAALGAVALLVAYAGQLRDVVHDWNSRAAISQKALVDLERETMEEPEGALVIVGVPAASWAFAVPLALRPPFTRTDLTRRVLVVSDSSLHCCPVGHWNEYTRQALQAWHGRADQTPVVAMYWDGRTGRLSRVADKDDPQLRTLISLILETDSRETLDSAIRGLLRNFVAVR
jgi:hypothetical protein